MAKLRPLPGVDNTDLDPDDEKVFIAVLREVQSVTDWSMLSLFLGINHDTAQAIKKENRRTYSEVQAYVRAWLNTGDATWAMLAAALREDLVGKKAVGNAIKAKYKSDRNNEIKEIIPVPTADGVDSSLLSTHDFTEVMESLQNVTEWSILSILLGVNESTLRHIKEDNEGDSLRAEQTIVKAWLEDTDNPSWAMLVTALQDNLVGMNGIAKKIKKQHSNTDDVQPLSGATRNPSTATPWTMLIAIPDTDTHKIQKVSAVYDFLRHKAYQWNDIGRGLKVDYSYRESLVRQGIQSEDSSKLENVIQKWFASKSSPLTWENLARVLRKIQFNDVVEEIVKKRLQ